MSYFTRYMAGEHEAVWEELSTLGEEVRSGDMLEDARAVAAETMRRVLHNLLRLQERLPSCGYRFNAPTLDPPRLVVRPASLKDSELLHSLEQEHGPLPLSLLAFYSIVGEVDLSQDYDQLVQWPQREEGAPYTELEILGEFNPLTILPLSRLMSHRRLEQGKVSVPLLPDEAGNAFYSGDYYYVWFPDAHADATLGAYPPGHERFVNYLRQAFRHSGFHGMISVNAPSSGERWNFPLLPCIADIAGELLPI